MKPLIMTLEEIKSLLPNIDLMGPIAKGFVAYSSGKAVIPAPGELSFENPRGDVHIKYGHIEGDDTFVVKIASGFYDNPSHGLPVGNGVMLAFARETGELSAVLLDGGLLTRVRTGVAGAIAARYLAPNDVRNIGVIGAGNQARWQIRMLKQVVSCRKVQVYCQERNEIGPYIQDMQVEGFTVVAADSPYQIAEECQLIVTTTPSRKPVLPAERVKPGTHITAVGADTPGKQELEAELFRRADLVVGDSKTQCEVRGECAHAIKEGALDPKNIVELGAVIDGSKDGRTGEDQITIADLTGVAVQDIAITRSIIAAVSG